VRVIKPFASVNWKTAKQKRDFTRYERLSTGSAGYTNYCRINILFHGSSDQITATVLHFN